MTDAPSGQDAVNCRDAGPGRALCVQCAEGQFARCLYVHPAAPTTQRRFRRFYLGTDETPPATSPYIATEHDITQGVALADDRDYLLELCQGDSRAEERQRAAINRLADAGLRSGDGQEAWAIAGPDGVIRNDTVRVSEELAKRAEISQTHTSWVVLECHGYRCIKVTIVPSGERE